MSNKILFTADTHVFNGIRKQVFINYIDFLKNYVEKNNIEHLVFGGDLFDKPVLAKLKNDTFIDVFFSLKELSKSTKLYFIIGNHTIHRIDNRDNIIRLLSPFGEIIDELKQFDFNGTKVDMMPYTDNFNEIPDSGEILLSHFPVKGMVYSGQTEEDESEKGVPIEKFSGFEIVLLGDIHKHQRRKNIVYSGSPYMTNYGERNLTKTGFLILDVNTKECGFEEYNEAPKYKQVTIEDALNEDVNNCFIKVEIKDKTENFIKLKHILYERGALEVLPEFKKIDDQSINIEDSIDFDFKNKIDNMLYDYIDSIQENKEIDKSKLKKILSGVIG